MLSQFLLENEGKRCVVVIDVRSQHFIVLSRETLTMYGPAGDREGRRTQILTLALDALGAR